MQRFGWIVPYVGLTCFACQHPQGTPGPGVAHTGGTRGAAGDLVVTDLEIGSGEPAAPGKTVFVHYSGRLSNGQEFDNSRARGAPIQFVVGKGMVIEGWDRGVIGMKVGGRRRLTIPPALAYGEQGAGETIAPGSTLVFELELVDVK